MSDAVIRLPDDVDTRATLSLIAQARQSLAEARTLPDIRRVMEVASVAADAGQRAARLAEAQHAVAAVVEAANDAANDAAAVRIEAQAKAGELLRTMAERGDRARAGDSDGRRQRPSATLDDLGITKSESSRWQQVASVPDEVRQQYVDATRAARQEVSTAGLLRHAHDVEPDRATSGPTPGSIDHPAIAAEARKRMRAVHRVLVDLAGYRPEALVSALNRAERRSLLRAMDQLPAWMEDVKRELAVHRVVEED
jgi:hypothetical protein